MVQLTSFVVICPYRRPLPMRLVPWEKIQLDNVAFPAQSYPFSVTLDKIFQSGHSVHICVFPSSFLQEIKICLIDSQVCPCSSS